MQTTFCLVGDSQEFLLFLQEELWLAFKKKKKIIGTAFVLRVRLGDVVFHF